MASQVNEHTAYDSPEVEHPREIADYVDDLNPRENPGRVKKILRNSGFEITEETGEKNYNGLNAYMIGYRPKNGLHPVGGLVVTEENVETISTQKLNNLLEENPPGSQFREDKDSTLEPIEWEQYVRGIE